MFFLTLPNKIYANYSQTFRTGNATKEPQKTNPAALEKSVFGNGRGKKDNVTDGACSVIVEFIHDLLVEHDSACLTVCVSCIMITDLTTSGAVKNR